MYRLPTIKLSKAQEDWVKSQAKETQSTVSGVIRALIQHEVASNAK